MVFRAPFRCEACGRRFNAFALQTAYKRNLPYPDAASFLGLRGKEQKLQQWIVTVVLVVIILLFAGWLTLRILA